MTFFFIFIGFLCQALTVIILIRAIFSWLVTDPRNPIMVILYQLTEPILAPLRRFLPRLGMLDISPLAAVFILQFIIYFLPS